MSAKSNIVGVRTQILYLHMYVLRVLHTCRR